MKNLTLLFSFSGTARTDFKPQLEGLDRNKFTIIAWDPPGYGSSRPPNRDFNHENFLARDAEVALKLLEVMMLLIFLIYTLNK